VILEPLDLEIGDQLLKTTNEQLGICQCRIVVMNTHMSDFIFYFLFFLPLPNHPQIKMIASSLMVLEGGGGGGTCSSAILYENPWLGSKFLSVHLVIFSYTESFIMNPSSIFCILRVFFVLFHFSVKYICFPCRTCLESSNSLRTLEQLWCGQWWIIWLFVWACEICSIPLAIPNKTEHGWSMAFHKANVPKVEAPLGS